MALTMTREKGTALEWIDSARTSLSEDHQTIWRFAEPAWREYRSANWYVERLRAEGFEVEAGSAGMPTAFCARRIPSRWTRFKRSAWESIRAP